MTLSISYGPNHGLEQIPTAFVKLQLGYMFKGINVKQKTGFQTVLLDKHYIFLWTVVFKVEPGEVLRHQSHPLLALLVIKLYLNIANSFKLVLNSCS